MQNVPDIYFLPEYGRMHESHEHGMLETFSYKTARGEVYFPFIKRPLTQYKGFEEYCDIVTPYGYGGPIFLGTEDGDKPALAEEFGMAFREYCRESRIVSAFVRFHPIIGNALEFKDAFDEVEAIRKTIAIDLTKDIFHEEFDKTVRRRYRNAEKLGLTVQYDPALETMETFITLYYALMDKKETLDYYYFPRKYFEDIRKLGKSVELVNAVLDGEIVGSVLVLKYGQFVHTHLSATTDVGNENRASEVIKASMSLKAKEEGFRWNHLGGGVTNDPDDSLFRFKRKFTQSAPFDFYIGKSICDPEAYEGLCALPAVREKAHRQQLLPEIQSINYETTYETMKSGSLDE